MLTKIEKGTKMCAINWKGEPKKNYYFQSFISKGGGILTGDIKVIVMSDTGDLEEKYLFELKVYIL